MTHIKNPSLFREMSEPFETADEAIEAMTAFQKELVTLREKHKIANVYCILNTGYKTDEGNETEALINVSFGDALKRETLTAWAYGYESVAREQAIADVIAGAKKQARK